VHAEDHIRRGERCRRKGGENGSGDDETTQSLPQGSRVGFRA
jgi:hypothetical protein